MRITDKAAAIGKRFRLDSHHGIERFGVFFAAFVLTGLLAFSGAGISAFKAARHELSDKALYNASFTTSKTELSGDVDGVYVNKTRDKALVVMHFGDGAQVSYNAADYQGFLLGSNKKLATNRVKTPGIKGSFYAFGSTGYFGVLLDAAAPFDSQIMNLTLRANAELSFRDQQVAGSTPVDMAGDASFRKFDQWRVFFNPGASGARHLKVLDAARFEPARAFYEVVTAGQEKQARMALDTQLQVMRADLSRIKTYSNDLATTKVDGLFLQPPTVPAMLAGDEVGGESKSESKSGDSTLALSTTQVVPGGINLDWRAGNVYDGYLDELVPADQTYVEWLQAKIGETETADPATESSQGRESWILSDGSNLETDYASSDMTVRPLVTVMNNLSQAYSDYLRDKAQYQSELMFDLLSLDVDLRDVETNSSHKSGKGFLVTYY